MEKSANDIYQDYVKGKIKLIEVPISKLSWSLLGKAAFQETENYIDYIFDLYETKKINIDIVRCIELLPLEYLQDIYKRFFEVNPEKNFGMIPIKFRNKEMCDTFFKLNPFVNFRLIPDKYKSQEMCDVLFRYDPLESFKLIPNKFKSDKMCDIYLKLNSNEKINLNLIPIKYRNKYIHGVEMNDCSSLNGEAEDARDNFVCKNADFQVKDRIFRYFKTQQEWDDFFDENPEEHFVFIPSKYKTQRMFETLFEINPGKYFEDIPLKFITQYMCDIMLELDIGRYFFVVPDSFKTQEVYDSFLELNPRVNFKYIPDEFKSEKIWKIMFDVDPVYYFKFIPEKYITPEMLVKMFYFFPKIFFDLIPYEFKTQEVYDKYFTIDPVLNINKIPVKFRTQEMFFELFKTNHYLLNVIEFDENVMTQALFDKLFEFNSVDFFDLIPIKFRTEEMYKFMLKKDVYKYSKLVPKELYSESIFEIVAIELKKLINNEITISSDSDLCLMVVRLYPSLVKVFEVRTIDDIIFNDIYLMCSEGGTVENIARKYNVSVYYINRLIEKIKDIDPVMYIFIKNKLEQNKKTWLANMQNDVLNLGQIILSLNIEPGFMNTEQKIKFVYLYRRYVINSLNDIYNFNYRKYCKSASEYFECIDNFFKNFIRSGYLSVNNSDFPIQEGIALNNSWLSKYDRSEFFQFRNGVCTAEYRYGKNEELLTLEIEEYVINLLKKESIPLNDLIVRCAFREYFDGTFNEYILKLQSYDGTYKSSKKKIKNM